MIAPSSHPPRPTRFMSLALVPALLLLPGCSGLKLEPFHAITDNVLGRSEELLPKAGTQQPDDRIERSREPLLPLSAEAVQPAGAPELARVVTFNQSVASLREFAARLEAESGLRIEVSADAELPMAAAGAASASGRGRSVPAGAGPLPSLPGSPVPAIPADPSRGAPAPTRITYEGQVRGLLDNVSRRFDLYWSEEGGGVVIRRIQSRTFRLSALAGSASGSSTIASSQSQGSASGGGGGSGGSGGAGGNTGKTSTTGQTATISFENLSPWAAVEGTVKSMLSEEGRLIVSPALGTLTVVDRRSAMDRVADFVRSTNAAMSRQVALNVKVYSVTLTNGEAYGLDWNLVFRQVQGMGMTIRNTAGLAGVNATNLGLQVISPPGDTSSARHFAGSEVMLKALSSLGRVSEQISTTLVTLNNQPVPLQVGRQQTYLASVSVSQVPNAGASTTLTPGQVTAGLDMSFVPHVLDDGRILLQYAMTLSDLNDITSIESNGAKIQLPNVNLRSFIQRVSIHSGEMLIMSGFEQMSAKTQQQGVGDARNVIFGGMQEGKSDRTAVVIVVQPTLL